MYHYSPSHVIPDASCKNPVPRHPGSEKSIFQFNVKAAAIDMSFCLLTNTDPLKHPHKILAPQPSIPMRLSLHGQENDNAHDRNNSSLVATSMDPGSSYGSITLPRDGAVK